MPWIKRLLLKENDEQNEKNTGIIKKLQGQILMIS